MGRETRDWAEKMSACEKSLFTGFHEPVPLAKPREMGPLAKGSLLFRRWEGRGWISCPPGQRCGTDLAALYAPLAKSARPQGMKTDSHATAPRDTSLLTAPLLIATHTLPTKATSDTGLSHFHGSHSWDLLCALLWAWQGLGGCCARHWPLALDQHALM